MNNKIAFIGIDPGKTGIIAVQSSIEITLHKMRKNQFEIKEIFDDLHDRYSNLVIYHEQVTSHAVRGKGMLTFGYYANLIPETLKYMGIEFELVRSQTWKKHFGITRKGKPKGFNLKQASVDLANDLQSKIIFHKTIQKRKGLFWDNNAAEAFLISEYGRQKWMARNAKNVGKN